MGRIGSAIQRFVVAMVNQTLRFYTTVCGSVVSPRQIEWEKGMISLLLTEFGRAEMEQIFV